LRVVGRRRQAPLLGVFFRLLTPRSIQFHSILYLLLRTILDLFGLLRLLSFCCSAGGSGRGGTCQAATGNARDAGKTKEEVLHAYSLDHRHGAARIGRANCGELDTLDCHAIVKVCEGSKAKRPAQCRAFISDQIRRLTQAARLPRANAPRPPNPPSISNAAAGSGTGVTPVIVIVPPDPTFSKT
jgi:hypothetical protein